MSTVSNSVEQCQQCQQCQQFQQCQQCQQCQQLYCGATSISDGIFTSITYPLVTKKRQKRLCCIAMLEVNRLKTFLLFLCHKWQFQSLTIFRSKHCFIRFVIMKYEKELRVTKKLKSLLL